MGNEKWYKCLKQFSSPQNFFKITIYLFIYLLGLNLWHMEVPRLGAELELQLQAYATAMKD